MNQKIFISLFFSLLFFTPISGRADRIGLASEDWKVIKTEHFEIVFTAKQQDLGLYYANQAEKAYENLATVFINRPENRIVIIVNDTTDISNGYATRIPYAHIMAYSVPIGEHESLSEAGDWGRELITHEMTHIMQFEPALGFYTWLRPVFGTIIAPNLLMPLWWKEGMAVEMETEFSPQGRARSHFQDASVRALVLDQKLFEYTLARANEVLPKWPYGSHPYLFGSLFWGSLVRDSSSAGVNQITSRQGERAPYAIEEPMRELVGRTYVEQYSKALNEAQENADQQIAKLKEQPLSEVKPVALQGQNAFSPRWSDDFKLLAFIEEIEGKGYVSVFNDQMQRVELKKRPSGELSSLEFQPHTKKILFAKVDNINLKYQVSDLYLYDLDTQKADRITQNQRAREASFSEDGKRIVFLSTYSGRTQVRILDVQTKKIETLISSSFHERYQSPIFWGTQEILYVKISENGSHSLYKMNLADKKEIPVSLNFEGLGFLRKRNLKGKNALYFVSAKNGVNNVYVSTDLKTAAPVTHVPAGVWSFDVNDSGQTIWAANMTSTGFQVAPLERRNLTSLPVIENKLAQAYKFVDKKTPDKNYSSEDYSAVSHLWPHYWIPFVSTSTTSRGVYLQAQTSGQDPIGVNEYSLLGSYDTDLKKGGFQGFYTNSSTGVPIQLAATVQSQAFGDVNNVVETKTGSIGFLPDVFKISKKMLVEFGAEFQQTDYFGSVTQHWGPFGLVQYIDYEQNIFQISPEKGWGAYLKYENWKNLKESRDFNRALGSAVAYFSPWLPTHHTMMTRVSALMTFETVPARFGTSNDSLFSNSDLILPQFVLRGYTPSQFYGRSVWNANAEYRFPIKRLDNGPGSDPYFLKRISGALVTDGLGVEGAAITEKGDALRRNLNQSYWSAGAELKLETTVGYVLPMNFILGGYMPFSPLYRSSAQVGVSIQIGGF